MRAVANNQRNSIIRQLYSSQISLTKIAKKAYRHTARSGKREISQKLRQQE